MKTFEDNDVINGSWGEVWVDNCLLYTSPSPRDTR